MPLPLSRRATRAARVFIVLTFLLVFAPPRTAHAQQRVYFAFYSGGMASLASDLRLTQPSQGTDVTFDDVRWRGRPFEGSIFYGYRAGMFFKKNPHLGIELDFTHSKAYAKVEEARHISGTWQGQAVDEIAPINSRVQEYRITNGVNTIGLNLVYRWNAGETSPGFPQGRLQPYVAAGPAYYILFPINLVDNERNERRNYQNSGFGVAARGGLRYGLTQHLSLFLEAKYTNGVTKVDIAGDDGMGETRLQTWHSIAGVEYGF